LEDLYPSVLEGDEPEPLELIKWPLANLHELVMRDDCTEGRAIAALYLARDYLANRDA
jgi:ADP-ribose diphosphatase